MDIHVQSSFLFSHSETSQWIFPVYRTWLKAEGEVIIVIFFPVKVETVVELGTSKTLGLFGVPGFCISVQNIQYKSSTTWYVPN